MICAVLYCTLRQEPIQIGCRLSSRQHSLLTLGQHSLQRLPDSATAGHLNISLDRRLREDILLPAFRAFAADAVTCLIGRAHRLAGFWIFYHRTHAGAKHRMIGSHRLVAVQRAIQNFVGQSVLACAVFREHALTLVVLERH